MELTGHLPNAYLIHLFRMVRLARGSKITEAIITRQQTENRFAIADRSHWYNVEVSSGAISYPSRPFSPVLFPNFYSLYSNYLIWIKTPRISSMFPQIPAGPIVSRWDWSSLFEVTFPDILCLHDLPPPTFPYQNIDQWFPQPWRNVSLL